MATFQIIPAQPWHCGQIVRALRAEQKDAFARLGVDPHKHLRACFDASFLTRAWLIDGALAAVGGIFGSSLSETGYIWLALSQDAMRYPVHAAREARRQLVEALTTKRTLIATSLYGDRTARNFMGFLGFQLNSAGPDAESWILRRRYSEAA